MATACVEMHMLVSKVLTFVSPKVKAGKIEMRLGHVPAPHFLDRILESPKWV